MGGEGGIEQYDLGPLDRVELTGFGELIVERTRFESRLYGHGVLVRHPRASVRFVVPYAAFHRLYDEGDSA